MSEQNTGNHWDELVSSLGATPSEETEKQPAVTPAQPVSKPQTKRRSGSTRKPGWDFLANIFGLASGKSEAEEHVAEEATIKEPGTSPEMQKVETSDQEASKLERSLEEPEESPNYFDERFDFTEPYDIIEAGEKKKDEEKEETPAITEEKAKNRLDKRRRRRKRGRRHLRHKADQRGGVRDNPQEEGKEQSASVVANSEEKDIQKSELLSSETETEEPRRSKKRRRKSKKQRRKEKAALKKQKSHELQDDDSVDADLHELHAEEGEFGGKIDESDDQPARIGFRGIPTWEDVVGIVITKNLEMRSKRPDGSGQNHNRHAKNGRKRGH